MTSVATATATAPLEKAGAGANESTSATSTSTSTSSMAAATTLNDASINNNNNNNNDVLFQAIASKASAAMSQPTVTLTIYIPSSAVGAVIGRRGQNIASLQKTAQQSAHTNQAVRVSIVGQADTAGNQDGMDQDGYPLSAAAADNHNMTTTSNNHTTNHTTNHTGTGTGGSGSSSIPYTYSKLDWSDAQWTPVVVRADPCAALAAAYKLQEMVGTNSGTSGTSGMSDPCSVVLDVPVSRTKHAAIVGKRGTALAHMSADYAVRIMVPNKMTRHDVVQLEGDLDHVCQCLVKVLHIAAKANVSSSSSKQQQQQQQNNTYNKQNAGDDPQNATQNSSTTTSGSSAREICTATLTVPVLPSQTKIRNLGRKTECTIKKKKMPMDHMWQLTVTGYRADKVEAAVAILNKWKEDNCGTNSNNSAAAATAASGNLPTPVTTTSDGADNNNSATATGGAPAPSPTRRNNNRGRGGGGGRNSNNNNKGTPKRGGKPQNRSTSSD